MDFVPPVTTPVKLTRKSAVIDSPSGVFNDITFTSPGQYDTRKQQPRIDKYQAHGDQSFHQSSYFSRNISEVKSSLIEKLEFSSPPASQSAISLDISEACNDTILSMVLTEDDPSSTSFEEVVTIRANQECAWNTMCYWDEHWWSREPLVKINGNAITILNVGLYRIQIDLGPWSYASENISLVVLEGSYQSDERTNNSWASTIKIHSSIPGKYFENSKTVFLSLQSNDRLLLVKRHMCDEKGLPKKAPSRSKEEANQEHEDVDACFPTMRLRKVEVEGM